MALIQHKNYSFILIHGLYFLLGDDIWAMIVMLQYTTVQTSLFTEWLVYGFLIVDIVAR